MQKFAEYSSHRLFAGVFAASVLMFSSAIADEGFRILHTFQSPKGGGPDGAYPETDLVMDRAGNLYGTTSEGGQGAAGCGCGTIFEIGPRRTETILHTFAGPDGRYPSSPLIRDAQGNLYGTTVYGGMSTACGNFGCGTVFKLAPDETETVLYSFQGSSDGEYPMGRLAMDSSGNIYGATLEGGLCYDCGTIFKIAPSGQKTTLYSFTGHISGKNADGLEPRSGVTLDKNGSLFGTTTINCGANCYYGTIWKIGSDGTFSTLYTFDPVNDGGIPTGASLILDKRGNLYGGASFGTTSTGTIFKFTPQGKFQTLYVFQGADGQDPEGTLTFDKAGNLFGTTVSGGLYGGGAVFKLTTDGMETVLHSFDGKDGEAPSAGVILDKHGHLFGTASSGGNPRPGQMALGTVFEIK